MLRRRLLVAATCLVPSALALPAQAATTTTLETALAATCPAPVAQSFLAWADAGWYAVAPGATFEAKSSKWTLTGAAARVLATKPFAIADGPSSYALSLPQGASATTPPFCATLTSPTARFALRLASTTTTPVLRVEVLWTSPTNGASRSAVIGRIGAKSDWAPSPAIPLWANLAALATKDGKIDLRLRLTAEAGSFLVDDVMIDPYKRR